MIYCLPISLVRSYLIKYIIDLASGYPYSSGDLDQYFIKYKNLDPIFAQYLKFDPYLQVISG